jgi:hypothetical protein
VEDKLIWDSIFEDIKIDDIMKSKIIKIYAVDLLEKIDSKYTPGVDGKAFRRTITLATTKKEPNEILEGMKVNHIAHRLASISKGSNQQVLMRRDAPQTPSEKLRSAMAGNSTGIAVSKLVNKEWLLIKEDPLKYMEKHSKLVKNLNNKLKYELLESLKVTSVSKYKSQAILRVIVPKTNGEPRSLEISTMVDRLMQK